jgi:hypothetical protein
MAKKNNGQFFIERRESGDYAIRRGGSERASAVEPTQRAAIERAHEIDPERAVHVERVRTTSFGQPNRWR